MTFDKRALLALVAIVGLIASPVAAAAGGYALNPSADQHPDTYYTEDQLTVEEMDRSSMGWLEYEDDSGNVVQIDAHVNGTDSGAKVGYTATHIQDQNLLEYPRKSAENNNSATWSDASTWTTAGQNSTSFSVSDADGVPVSGVQSVNISTVNFATGDTAYAEYSNQSITTDVEKRYLALVLDLPTLETGAELSVQVRDSDGDYVEAVANTSRDASAADVIANATGDGIIYQEQLGKLTVKGTGDGTLGEIADVRVVVTDGDATAHITGLNLQKKSQYDFGEERVLDTTTDDSGDYKDATVRDRPNGGQINASSLNGLGSAFDDATVHKLKYWDVRYAMQDAPSTVNIEFSNADSFPGFDVVLDVSWRRTIPSAYDLTHGNIELIHKQTFLSERYTQLRYAEGVGDTETSQISDSSWVDVSNSLGDKNKSITIDSTVQSDTTYVAQFEVKLLEQQRNALEAVSGGGGGFWGGDGGGPFQSLWNWAVGGIVGLLTMVGIKKRGS